jgi:hypothetical protein
MATVRLEGWEDRGFDLPPVCMKCGAPATQFKERTFSWHSQWVYVLLLAGLVPFVIIALVLTKRMRVAVPFCDAHAGHWWKRNLFIVGGLLLLIAMLIFGAVRSGPGGNDSLSRALLIAVGIGFLVWIVLAIIVSLTMIRPTEITANSITLTAVSPAFVDAVEEEGSAERGRGLDLDRDVRERWEGRQTRDADREGRYGEERRDEPPEGTEGEYRRGER